MSQKCPDWDILELLCRLHQSQIPNVLPAVCSSVSYYYYSRLLKALLGSFCFAVTHHFRGHTHTQQCNDTSQQFFWHHHTAKMKRPKGSINSHDWTKYHVLLLFTFYYVHKWLCILSICSSDKSYCVLLFTFWMWSTTSQHYCNRCQSKKSHEATEVNII